MRLTNEDGNNLDGNAAFCLVQLKVLDTSRDQSPSFDRPVAACFPWLLHVGDKSLSGRLGMAYVAAAGKKHTPVFVAFRGETRPSDPQLAVDLLPIFTKQVHTKRLKSNRYLLSSL